jgi:hypothetical protein
MTESTMVDALDALGDRLARRVATVLVEHRRAHHLRLRTLARRSMGRFSVRDLRRFERARTLLTPALATEVTDLYGVELREAFVNRVALDIRPFGVVSSSTDARSFDPDDTTSVLGAYIELVRACRSDHTTRLLELRRSDIDVLAENLGVSGDIVVDRLAALMGASDAQRRIMAGMYLTGATSISVEAAANAIETASWVDPDDEPSLRAAPSRITRVAMDEDSMAAWTSLAIESRAANRRLLAPQFSWSRPISTPASIPRHHAV